MSQPRYHLSLTELQLQLRPNFWDAIALLLILGILAALAWATMQMTSSYQIGDTIAISLSPEYLPSYALRTTLRILIAMIISLIFTLTVGTLAAKQPAAERLLIPMIDILQSIPVLSFLAITVIGFIHLFPGSLLGPECASIFAIFTAQAWNMALGFYQSLKNLPTYFSETASLFHLSAWQKFWRIEVPFSLPSLLWNMMMSMSASWFFVVASEAIAVANQTILLPGIGSYIAVAIAQTNFLAISYAIMAMFIVILIYDQLLFRPLLQWSARFQISSQDEGNDHSWVMALLNKTGILIHISTLFAIISNRFVNAFPQQASRSFSPKRYWSQYLTYLIYMLIGLAITMSTMMLAFYIDWAISLSEVIHVIRLGLITSLRVFILIILSSLIWVPIGVWVGMRPYLAYRIQPIIQFLASFPANLVFPLVVSIIIRYQLNIEIWTAPLMILGSQWYILFNVIAGTIVLPKDLYHTINNLGVHGWLWWRRFILPGIFPYYITGAMTAAGGAWNASIVAEWVNWGETILVATGLGSYITQYTHLGDFHRIALGTAIMCLYVLLFNQLLWQPLYKLAENRFKLA